MKKLFLLALVIGSMSHAVLATAHEGEELSLEDCIFANQDDRGDDANVDNEESTGDSSGSMTAGV